MADSGLTAEEFATWIRASDAIELVNSEIRDHGTAAYAILQRLANGLIRSSAENAIAEEQGRKSEMFERFLIPLVAWKNEVHQSHVGSRNFWRTNDGELNFANHVYSTHSNIKLTFFGIRFDPAGIVAMLAPKKMVAPVVPTPAQSLIAVAPDKDPVRRGPDVSDAHLAAWFQLYKKVYQGPEDTLIKAHESAKGMFQGKFVSRDKVRALFDSRKPGRKSKPAD